MPYYVEAGAHNGVGDSQTLELEAQGWNGLCIEPSSAFQSLKISRRCEIDNRALGDGRTIVFREVHGTELSGAVEHFQNDGWERGKYRCEDRIIGTVTLTQMLLDHEAPPIIDKLFLDTEGSELVILQHHNFALYSFLSICVEYNGLLDRRRELIDFLKPKGYFVHIDDGTNLHFILVSK